MVVVPFSTAARAHSPIPVPVTCQGKDVVAVSDQVRAMAKHRLRAKIEEAPPKTLTAVTSALAQILEIA